MKLMKTMGKRKTATPLNAGIALLLFLCVWMWNFFCFKLKLKKPQVRLRLGARACLWHWQQQNKAAALGHGHFGTLCHFCSHRTSWSVDQKCCADCNLEMTHLSLRFVLHPWHMSCMFSAKFLAWLRTLSGSCCSESLAITVSSEATWCH